MTQATEGAPLAAPEGTITIGLDREKGLLLPHTAEANAQSISEVATPNAAAYSSSF